MNIQYVTDEDGETTGVLVPIKLWHEIASERETAYLLKNKIMKKRLLDARNRQNGIPFNDLVTCIIKNGNIVVKPVKKRYTLDELLEDTTEIEKELDWGKAMGNEDGICFYLPYYKHKTKE
ncbi:hypothetical protein GMMP13_840004 [Candidatus Magnetomoraceae bacterium gMMP-13]